MGKESNVHKIKKMNRALLRETRIRKGIKLGQAEIDLGIPRQTLHSIEKGKNCQLDKIETYANYLGLELSLLELDSE